jgi:Zn-dependent M16 (insulinase) family peptidase
MFEVGHKLPKQSAKEEDIKVINIELNDLPKNTNTKELQKELFKNVHVINVETNVDNITG